MGAASNTYGRRQKCIEFLQDSWKEENAEKTQEQMREYYYVYVEETGYECVDQIQIAQGKEQWQAFVNSVRNFPIQ